MARKAKPSKSAAGGAAKSLSNGASPADARSGRKGGPVHHHAPMEARVLGGPVGPVAPETVWDREPLLTLSAERRLFQAALPTSIVSGLLVGLALLRFGLTAALIGMLVVQTGGCFAAYVIAQRRRIDPLRGRPAPRGSRDSD